jgi:hypothetical protein
MLASAAWLALLVGIDLKRLSIRELPQNLDKKESRSAEKEHLIEKPESGADSAAIAEADEEGEQGVPGTPGVMIPGFLDVKTSPAQGPGDMPSFGSSRKFVAYTIKLPAEQLAALQSIWLELKRLYGSNSPDKSGMIQLAVQDWLKRWDGPDKAKLLNELLEIRQDTRKRQHKRI